MTNYIYVFEMMAEIKQCGTDSEFQVENEKGGGDSPFLFRFPQIKLRKKGDRAAFSRFIMEFVTKVYTLQALFHSKKIKS